MAVKVDLESFKLTDNTGLVYDLFQHEFWYLAPCKYKPVDQFDNRWQEFAILLHNARIAEGFVTAQNDLLTGISVSLPQKSAGAKEAEKVFENIRSTHYPDKPSRLRCHFLSLTREQALKRQTEWGGFEDRLLTRCYLVLNGSYHYADVTKFERYARGELKEDLVHEYWQPFEEGRFSLKNVEVLADSALYFPDWSQFRLLDFQMLAEWNNS